MTPKPNYPLQDAQVSTLSTSKVWVLPPRPKPGRKPSTDTPPTKRKAQNRAAQRAFRERRAARVNELEGMLVDVNHERDEREKRLSETLKSMSEENKELRNSLDELRREIRALQSGSRRVSYGTDAGTPGMESRASYAEPGAMPYPPSMNQMASPAPSMDSMDVLDRVLEMTPRMPVPNPAPEVATQEEQQEEEDCGICTKEDCLCVSIGIKEAKPPVPEPVKEVTSEAVPLKRRRNSNSNAPNLNPFKKLKQDKPQAQEVDFTAQFSKPPVAAPAPPPPQRTSSNAHAHAHTTQPESLSNPNTPVDKCGFCSDGTPCLCADAAADEASNMADLQGNTLPPLFSDPSTPKGGEKVQLPSLNPSGRQETAGCTGNPGTCSQCQADPMSTLFCTTLASQVEEKSSGGCCGGSKSGSGGCCKDKTAAPTPPPAPGTFIPCSAAYQTLSRHKDFGRADLGSLVGKLNTRGMQVEVSSVANVLRELDRRLYQ